MAKTSFKMDSEPAPQAETPNTETAVAVREERAVAPSTGGMSYGDFEGYDSGPEDIRTPRLALANKSGKLGDSFTPGVFVFNKLVALSKDNKTPVNAIVLKVWPYFQEILKTEPGEEFVIPKKCKTPEEVEALGGTLIFEQRNVKQLWGKAADILIAVEKPEGELPEEAEGQFYIRIGEKDYALAMWSVAKSAYKAVYPVLKTATKTWASKQGIMSAKWKLTSELVKTPQNSWWSPVIRGCGTNTPEVIELLTELRKPFDIRPE